MSITKQTKDFIDAFINKINSIELDTDTTMWVVEHIIQRRRVSEKRGKLIVDNEHVRVTTTHEHTCENCEKNFYMSEDSPHVNICPYCGITFEASDLF